MRRLIVTGDDFGSSDSTNAAIERAHLDGILTAASLMVGAEATADAIQRARRLPSLKIGLHVVLVCGRPVLPASAVPDLVDDDGNFSRDLIGAGFRFFFRPAVRRQITNEIRAQFEAFAATGLELDHVNAHKHMHLHPTVCGSILDVGREYGMRAMRIPYEPPLLSWRCAREGLLRRSLTAAGLAPWVRFMLRRVRTTHLQCNDYVFGLHDSGGMTVELVLRLLPRLPDGVSEIYFHPALASASREDGELELAALVCAEVREALQSQGIQRIAFSDLVSAGH